MNSKIFSEIKQDLVLHDLTYFDNAELTLLSKSSLAALVNQCYSVEQYDNARSKVQRLINARREDEIIFTPNSAYGLNIVAKGICSNWNMRDCVIVPESEHYSNLLVWRELAIQQGFRFETVNVIKDGSLDLGHLDDILDSCDGKILYSMSHISNTIGYLQPIKQLFDRVKEYDGITVLDASLSINKETIDVQQLDADFLVFNSHNLYSVAGVGILYGKHKYLEKIAPLVWGDNMASYVSVDEIEPKYLPHCLEAGTPNYSGVIALAQTIDWFTGYDIADFKQYNAQYNENLQEMLLDLDFIKVFHPGKHKSGLISFSFSEVHSLELVDYLKANNIAVNGGYLNAQPIVEEKFTTGVVRVSWDIGNTLDDIETLRRALVDYYNR